MIRGADVNWASYRLGDIVRGFAVHQARHYHHQFPSSIASEYLRRKNQTMDLPVLCAIAHERAAVAGKAPSDNDLVVHIRLGDVARLSGSEMWENGVRVGKAMQEYVRPRAYYEHLTLPPPSAVSTVILVGSDIHRSHGDFLNQTEQLQNSASYKNILREWFESKGYAVQEYHNRLPDEDFVQMATAKMFVFGGGGFSFMAGWCVEKCGGKVYGYDDIPGGKSRRHESSSQVTI
jgi:hypothetical protein